MADVLMSGDAYETTMGRWSARLAPLVARFAGVEDGGRVLDVGCGTGAMVRAVANVARQSQIVGIDASGAFIDYCRKHFTGPQFQFQVGDALQLPFGDASFDRCLSLLVLMFVARPGKAASEMRRVTRPGGTVAACTWDRTGLEMNAIFWEEAIELDPDAEAKAERTRHCNQEGQLGDLWRTAGLDDVQETALQIDTPFESFDDYWAPYSGGAAGAGAYVASLTEGRRSALREALCDRLLPGGVDGPFALRAKAWAVRGTVPE